MEVSTHSFRRTALTQMSSAGIPLRVIQKISGHRSLQALQRYLEVSELQLEGAIASLIFQVAFDSRYGCTSYETGIHSLQESLVSEQAQGRNRV
ncbi:tyrosine-type recombinase/integrase [Trichocoleus desertorum]|uniref:tyrosine-type recombinase/integrase n=1 Tax=Trichocoleus desertorum TaxID=1481672 RepID=UPI003D65CB44